MTLAAEYHRPVVFETGGKRFTNLSAVVWWEHVAGSHTGNAAYILDSLDIYLTKFLNEYLKVNQK